VNGHPCRSERGGERDKENESGDCADHSWQGSGKTWRSGSEMSKAEVPGVGQDNCFVE
jgi:hypothetical protein